MNRGVHSRLYEACREADILQKSAYGEHYRALKLEKGQELNIKVKLK